MHRPTMPSPKLRVTHRPGFGDQPRLLYENVEIFMQLAEHAADRRSFDRYKQLEAAWLSLAESADWLEGKIPPLD